MDLLGGQDPLHGMIALHEVIMMQKMKSRDKGLRTIGVEDILQVLADPRRHANDDSFVPDLQMSPEGVTEAHHETTKDKQAGTQHLFIETTEDVGEHRRVESSASAV